jgi:NAD(P)-dependent dehydrogenase (short-subunit alcohol dehydrogenase family)
MANRGGALVTGGAGGIGWAICQRLAELGYRVAIADLNAEDAMRRAASLGPDHQALGVDLTDRHAAATLVARAAAVLPGGLSLIVNNAGMTDTGGNTLCDMAQDSFDRIIALNLTAVEEICDAALATLSPGGVVINIASGAAWRPLPLRGPYSATKAAMVALTEALAPEFAARGLRIGGVAPGYTLTPLVEDLSRAGRLDLEAVATAIPLGRLARPHDIASGIAFMASDAGGVLAGQTLTIDGGSSLGQAPTRTTTARGVLEGSGALAWLGTLPAATGFTATTAKGLAAFRALEAVIDCTAFENATAAEVLNRARDTARACAAHPARTRDFALVFVSRPGNTPLQKAAQTAQVMLARTLALEWAPAGLRVNAVDWQSDTDVGLAGLCRFLTGPEAGFITGQTIVAGRA